MDKDLERLKALDIDEETMEKIIPYLKTLNSKKEDKKDNVNDNDLNLAYYSEADPIKRAIIAAEKIKRSFDV